MTVVDSNVIAYLLIRGEHTSHAEQALRTDSHWVAPMLWRSEVRNVLATYVRLGHFSAEFAMRLMNQAHDLMRGGEYEVRSDDVLHLAARSGCSAYDCEFVALAKDLEAPLLTSDRKLLHAFPNIAVPLVR